MEVDLHVHSMYSVDSFSKPERIVERALKVGLGAIAITDHDSWEGYRAAERLQHDGLLIVPGAELKTDRGDVLALFVDEEVEASTFSETIDSIRSAGGIAVVPHPMHSKRLTKQDLALADAIEGFNANSSPRENRLSEGLAKALNKPALGSSDAHVISAIGNGRTYVDDSSSIEELRKNLLRSARISRRALTNPLLHRGNALICFGLKGLWRL